MVFMIFGWDGGLVCVGWCLGCCRVCLKREKEMKVGICYWILVCYI